MENSLSKILDFARQAHNGQQRKFVDEPYINHPVRVMELCRQYTTHVPVLAAALLHDVLEDTDTSRAEIEVLLSETMDEAAAAETLDLVIELTDIYTKQKYPHWNRRKRKTKEAERLAATSAHAQTIKYADIIDNSDIVNADTDFAPRFLHECRQLLQKITKGDPRLRQRAVDRVNECLDELQVRQSAVGNRQ